MSKVKVIGKYQVKNCFRSTTYTTVNHLPSHLAHMSIQDPGPYAQGQGHSQRKTALLTQPLPNYQMTCNNGHPNKTICHEYD